MEVKSKEEIPRKRFKRIAYTKAEKNIKKLLTDKRTIIKRDEPLENENVSEKKMKKDSQTRKKKYATSSSDEEDTKNGSKYSKVNENLTETKRCRRKITKKKPIQSMRKLNETVVIQEISSKKKSVRTNLHEQDNDYNESTDESLNIKKCIKNKVKRLLSTSSEDEVTEIEKKDAKKNVAQILARKSLAKAKLISLAKQKKNEELKENKEQMPEQITKSLLNDKPNIKHKTEVQKVTPLSKIKMQSSIPYPKALTASGANIVTNVDSFIQPPKSINKANSVKLEDKRQHEEDARKKRERGLRLQTEEEKRGNGNKQTFAEFKTKAEIKRELIPLKERVHCNECTYFVHYDMIHNLRTHMQRMHQKEEKAKAKEKENIPPKEKRKN